MFSDFQRFSSYNGFEKATAFDRRKYKNAKHLAAALLVTRRASCASQVTKSVNGRDYLRNTWPSFVTWKSHRVTHCPGC